MKSQLSSPSTSLLDTNSIQLLTSLTASQNQTTVLFPHFYATFALKLAVVNGWNRELTSVASTLRLLLATSLRLNGHPLFPLNDTTLSKAPTASSSFRAAARTIRALPRSLRSALDNCGRSPSKGRSTLLHPNFLNLNSSFQESTLPLFHPYVPFTTSVFDWDGVEIEDFAVSQQFLDLQHKIVRRKVFLTTLNRLTKKIRVYSPSLRYNFNYKDYATYREGVAVTSRYTKINPKATSFLNSYEFKSEGWGLFVACKSQVLTTFFQAYTFQLTEFSPEPVGRFDSDLAVSRDLVQVINPFLHFFNRLPNTPLGRNYAPLPAVEVVEEGEEPRRPSREDRESLYTHTSLVTPEVESLFDQLAMKVKGNFTFNYLRFTGPRARRLDTKEQVRAMLNPVVGQYMLNLRSLNILSQSRVRRFPTSLKLLTLPNVALLSTGQKRVKGRFNFTPSRLAATGALSRSFQVTPKYLTLKLFLSNRDSGKVSLNRSSVGGGKLSRLSRSDRRRRRSLRHHLMRVRGKTLPRLPRFTRSITGRTSKAPTTLQHRALYIDRLTGGWESNRSGSWAHFTTLAGYRAVVSHIMNHFHGLRAVEQVNSFHKHKTNLVHLRAARARKYKRTRRTRRVTAATVLAAEEYTHEVRMFDNWSSQIVERYLGLTVLKSTHRLTVPTWATFTSSTVATFAAQTRRTLAPSKVNLSLGKHFKGFNLGTTLLLQSYKGNLTLNLPSSALSVSFTRALAAISHLLRNLNTQSTLCSFTMLGAAFFDGGPLISSLNYTRICSYGHKVNLYLISSTRAQGSWQNSGRAVRAGILTQNPNKAPEDGQGFQFSRPEITSYYDVPFIFSNIGFLFLSSPLSQVADAHTDQSMIKARIHKHRLSFFYDTELKRVFLNKPGLLRLLSSFKESDSLINKDHFIPARWKVGNNAGGSQHTTLASHFFNFSIAPERYLDRFETTLNDGAIEPDLALRRIRFKPGYQRIWRQARQALNKAMGFNFRYQVGLTKRLMWLRRSRRVATWRVQELTLSQVLLNSHFVFDMSASLLLVQSNTVFLNGVGANNPNLKLFVGDFIQLIVTLRYYIVFRWLVNWNNYHNLRFKKLLNYRNNSSRSDLSKQVSRHLPDWIFTIGYRTLDIANYLEVDYFTLSTFVLYEPLEVTDLHPLTMLNARPEIYTMYNWKYIN